MQHDEPVESKPPNPVNQGHRSVNPFIAARHKRTDGNQIFRICINGVNPRAPSAALRWSAVATVFIGRLTLCRM